jgi:hypothetical protein
MAHRTAPTERNFWSRVRKSDGCWEWTGGHNALGYGLWSPKRGEQALAHRVAYEALVGPIPPGLVSDHLCRNPPCVRPDHLEMVPQRINVLRGTSPAARHRTVTHCPLGHEYTSDNTYLNSGKRSCRTCAITRSRARRLAS